jgi:hypothetical protein
VRVDYLTIDHLQDVRRSRLLFHVAKRALYTEWRDAGDDALTGLRHTIRHHLVYISMHPSEREAACAPRSISMMSCCRKPSG